MSEYRIVDLRLNENDYRLGTEIASLMTWDEFFAAWETTCRESWDAGHQEPTVTLPSYVFPHATAVANPVTGRLVTITRTSPFTWEMTSKNG